MPESSLPDSALEVTANQFMTRKISVETDYAQVIEVKATFDEAQANALLKAGNWTLLHGCVAHKDETGYQAKPCWLLGRIASKTE